MLEPSNRSDAEGERITYGQRRINLLWERTQAVIALSVVEATIVVVVVLVLRSASGAASGTSDSAIAFVLLSGLANLVIGFYFGRTNHTRTGGVTGEGER